MSTAATLIEEMRLRAQGYRLVAGVDEAGRGPLAGPVVAAAVILPLDDAAPWLHVMRDSKLLTPGARERLYEQVCGGAIAVGTGIVGVDEIDALGIGQASRIAMQEAIAGLSPSPDYLLVDGYGLPGHQVPQKGIIKGDQRCLSIAAASIVAKVTRDRLMVDLDAAFPGYGFARHKGYGTEAHLACLRDRGPCLIHRRSFSPVAAALAEGS